MKIKILASILLTASVSMAETTTTTTAPAAPAKKVAKKSTAKKAEVAAVAQAPVAPAAAPVVAAPATQAATVTTTVAPAAPAKKWSVTLLNESSISNDGAKVVKDAEIKTINYVGAGYKITDTEKVGLRQYFSYKYDPKSEKSFESSDIKQDFTVVTLSTKTKGLLGSEDIAPMFWYYLPTSQAEVANFKKEMDDFYGILRMDAEIAWTLNPTWSVSYYLNPRQTLGAKNEETGFQATSRLVHYGYVYFNANDTTQFYGYAGFDHRMASETLTSTSDTYLSGVGASFSFLGGKLFLNPEIATFVPLKTKGVTASNVNLYDQNDYSYVLTTALSF